jgi:hypothetical protein
LKILHKRPRPIRTFIPKSKGEGDNHHEKNIIMKLNKGESSRVLPYGITWRLVLLKVLPKPPRPIRIFIPKLEEINKERTIMKLNKGESSRVQYLMGLHGC